MTRRALEPGELTPKQTEVVQLICAGLTSREIATQMGRSFRTVEVHRYMAKKRLGVKTLAGLMREAMERGIVTIKGGRYEHEGAGVALEKATQRGGRDRRGPDGESDGD